MEISPTHYAATRAASVAENCINYQQGTPHKVFLVQTVQQASKEVSLLGGEARGSACPTTPTPIAAASEEHSSAVLYMGLIPELFAFTVRQRTYADRFCAH